MTSRTAVIPLGTAIGSVMALVLGGVIPARISAQQSVSGASPRKEQEIPMADHVVTPTGPVGVVAFVNATVVPMDTERVLQDQTVIVKDGRIAALGPAGALRVPNGAVRVDARGKVLIPGLADMHAHISHANEFREQDLTPADRLLVKEQQAFLWLAHGLTTVRILDHVPFLLGIDFRGDDLLQLRARAAAGEILSPRIYTSGYIKGWMANPTEGPLTLDEVAEAVSTYKAAGFDFIKVHPQTIDDPMVFDSLVAAARRAGLPLIGHTVVPIERALATYRSIEHLSGYFRMDAGTPHVFDEPGSMKEIEQLEPQIRELAAATRHAGVWNTPTLYVLIVNNYWREPAVQALLRRIVAALQEAGAGLLIGSDGLNHPRWCCTFDAATEAQLRQVLTPEQQRLELMYGYADATHHELQQFVAAGLTPYQALTAGTRNVAAYFGALDSTGTITVGKRADLVLLEGNPLVDIRQTERVAGVMLGGRWLDRAELDHRTAEIRAWLTRRCSAAAGISPCSGELRIP